MLPLVFFMGVLEYLVFSLLAEGKHYLEPLYKLVYNFFYLLEDFVRNGVFQIISYVRYSKNDHFVVMLSKDSKSLASFIQENTSKAKAEGQGPDNFDEMLFTQEDIDKILMVMDPERAKMRLQQLKRERILESNTENMIPFETKGTDDNTSNSAIIAELQDRVSKLEDIINNRLKNIEMYVINNSGNQRDCK